MTSSPVPRSVQSTGNLRVAFVTHGSDPLSATVLNAAPDVTFHLTGDGYTPTISENAVTSSRLGARQVLSGRGTFGEDLAIEYIFGGDDADLGALLTDLLAEGTLGYLVVRRGIPNETVWAAGQTVAAVHTVECGRQQLQPPDENGLDRIKQALYTTAPTQYLTGLYADSSTVGSATVGTATVTA